MKASRLLDASERTSVEAAVVAAERRTAGEIVVVLATRSGRYDRGEDLFGVLLAMLAVAALWSWFGFSSPPSAIGLIELLALFLVAFSLGTGLAAQVQLLGTFFTSRAEMAAEVEEHALAAFHRLAVRRTAGATGVLIYVSLLERMVWVVGDDAVSERLDRADYEALRDLVVEGFRTGQAASGLERAVTRCGELLAEHFPARAEEPNELQDRVRFID